MIFQITTLFVTDIGFDYIAPNPTGDDLTSFFETVVLLSEGEIDSKKVRVEFSLENMDMSGFQKGATHPQIKEYVQEHSGLTSICETVQRPAGRYQCPVSIGRATSRNGCRSFSLSAASWYPPRSAFPDTL